MTWAALILILLVLTMTDTVSASHGSASIAGTIMNTYGNVIVREAQGWNLPEARVFSVVYQESKGDPNALGAAGEIGLMQVTNGALSDVNRALLWKVSPFQLYDGETNIRVGVAYLGLLKRQFSGDVDRATQAYNAGATGVRNNPEAGLSYLKRVKSHEALFTM